MREVCGPVGCVEDTAAWGGEDAKTPSGTFYHIGTEGTPAERLVRYLGEGWYVDPKDPERIHHPIKMAAFGAQTSCLTLTSDPSVVDFSLGANILEAFDRQRNIWRIVEAEYGAQGERNRELSTLVRELTDELRAAQEAHGEAKARCGRLQDEADRLSAERDVWKAKYEDTMIKVRLMRPCVCDGRDHHLHDTKAPSGEDGSTRGAETQRGERELLLAQIDALKKDAYKPGFWQCSISGCTYREDAPLNYHPVHCGKPMLPMTWKQLKEEEEAWWTDRVRQVRREGERKVADIDQECNGLKARLHSEREFSGRLLALLERVASGARVVAS